MKNKYLKSPWLEVIIMTVVVVLSYLALALISYGSETPPDGLSAWSITAILFGSFIASFCLALVAVIAGIGGGVLFTPVMLAFTAIDSLVIRATGLVVAMFSGLVSTKLFMNTGLGNLKVCIFGATIAGIGALTGATSAIYVAEYMGPSGEGFIRIALGGIILFIAALFFFGGGKVEWPEVKKSGHFAKLAKLEQPYVEKSLGRVINYKVKRARWFLLAAFGIGLLSGFFGLGGGWALVPAQNLIAGIPLKVSAANSGILLGMIDSIGVWPYLLMGAVIPLFVAPWLVGQVVGGIVGAHILVAIKAGFVRLMLIGIMIFTAYGLVTRGLNILGLIGEVPGYINMAVFLLIMSAVVFSIWKFKQEEKTSDKADELVQETA